MFQAVFDASWDRAGRILVERAIERHGGAAWRDVGVLQSTISIDGFLLRMKGIRRLLCDPRTIRIDVHAGRTELADFPAAGSRGIFERGDVRIEGADGIVESRGHRRTFDGFMRTLRRWSALDALYFFGYALSSYLTFPFVFPSLQCMRVRRIGGHDALTLAFPEGTDVHSRVQTFFLDETGLIVRNDYVAEIAGAWWRGAHSWEDPVVVAGILVPTRRRVTPRLGHLRIPFPLAVNVAITGSRSESSTRSSVRETPVS
jgi:hypothetical protein